MAAAFRITIHLRTLSYYNQRENGAVRTLNFDDARMTYEEVIRQVNRGETEALQIHYLFKYHGGRYQRIDPGRQLNSYHVQDGDARNGWNARFDGGARRSASAIRVWD